MTTSDPTSETGGEAPPDNAATMPTMGPLPIPTRAYPAPSFVLYHHGAGADVEAALPAIAEALQESVGDGSPFADAWGQLGVTFRLGIVPPPSDRRPGELAIHIRPSLPETPQAAAYHDVIDGVPDIEVGRDTFETLTSGAFALSVGIDHEVKETLKDFGANQESSLPDGRTAKAFEMCDEVQNTSYPAANGTHLSNFLLPSAFIPGAPAPWDFLSVKASQEDYTNGYVILFTIVNGEGTNAIVPGARHLRMRGPRAAYLVGAELTPKQAKRKANVFSRTRRRGVRIAP